MIKEKNSKRYSTQQIWIKAGRRCIHHYFQTMCENSKNIYNTSNFYIRQVILRLTNGKELHPLQKEVLDHLHNNIDAMNKIQKTAYKKALAKEMKKPVETVKK